MTNEQLAKLVEGYEREACLALGIDADKIKTNYILLFNSPPVQNLPIKYERGQRAIDVDVKFLEVALIQCKSPTAVRRVTHQSNVR